MKSTLCSYYDNSCYVNTFVGHSHVGSMGVLVGYCCLVLFSVMQDHISFHTSTPEVMWALSSFLSCLVSSSASRDLEGLHHCLEGNAMQKRALPAFVCRMWHVLLIMLEKAVCMGGLDRAHIHVNVHMWQCALVWQIWFGLQD